ncbi:MAG: DVUA0089 family protein [Bryobacteraceae bacterium]
MRHTVFAACLSVVVCAVCARADISHCVVVASGATSCTGALDDPTHFFETMFTVSGQAGINIITIQTYGFGGGTNANGDTIAGGGFDPLIAVFSAAPESILVDGGGNSLASLPGSAQFFPGCGPAGTRAIATDTVCGDSTLTVSLAPGSYSLVLSDAAYIPFAVSPGPPISSALSDGFADLTGGVFRTCSTTGACISDTGSFAVDIVGLPVMPVPEPSSLALVGAALAPLLYKRFSPLSKKENS